MTDTYSDPFSTIHPQDHLAMAGLQQDSAAMGRTGPSINKGKSKQDYRTPLSFLNAVIERFKISTRFDVDVAADDQNKVANIFFDEALDGLAVDWTTYAGNFWCNPPHGDCGRWAEKCRKSASNHRRVFLLVPAAVGSNWFADNIDRQALVLFLRPRLSFDGINSYPRDLILCVFGSGPISYECWKWK